MLSMEVLNSWGKERKRENDARRHRKSYDPLKGRDACEKPKLCKYEDNVIVKKEWELEITTEVPQFESGLLEVPYSCYHCGGRSNNLTTLKSHIKEMHREKLHRNSKGDLSRDDNSMERMMKINEIVEVQIKEEPEFLVPLDLSKKVQESQVWIKEEPVTDYEVTADPLAINLPKIRVASVEVLKAREAALPLLNRPTIPQQTPTFPFGSYVNQLLRVPTPPRHQPPQDPLALNARFATSFAPIAVTRIPQPIAPKPRMPNTFAQGPPYFLEVPYICHHCGGRSGDLDTLKTHIETMHNPELLYKERKDAEARKRLYVAISANKEKKPNVRKEKEKKEKKVKIKKEKIKREKPVKDINGEKKLKKQKNLENRPFSCPFCEFKATNFPGLVLHAKAIHEKERAQKRLEAELAAPPPDAGQPKKIKKPFHCLFCDYRGIQQQQVKKHMYAIHAKQKRLQCPFCPHRSAYSENMKWHIISKHKNKCPHCDFRATTKATLLAHQKSNCKLVFDALPSINEKTKASEVKSKSKDTYSNNEEEPSVGSSETASNKNVQDSGNKSLVNNNQDLLLVNNQLESSHTSTINNSLQENGEALSSEENNTDRVSKEATSKCDVNESVIIKQEKNDPPIKIENIFHLTADCDS